VKYVTLSINCTTYSEIWGPTFTPMKYFNYLMRNMKIRRLLAALTIALVVLTSGCKKDEYQAKVGVCPVVVSTIPASAAVNVPLNQVISVTFNEVMNPETFTPESFTLQGTTVIAGTKAATVVTGVFTFSDKTVIFTPSSPLVANTTYKGTVKTAVRDLAGNALQVEYVWSFATGVPPTVTTTDPANNATGVALNKTVTAIFSVPMDPLTITTTSVKVKQGTTTVAGAVSYTGSTVSFVPTAPFAANKLYTATITTTAANLSGSMLASDYVWSFTTGQSTTTGQPSLFSSSFGAFGGNAGITNQGIFTAINNGSIGTTGASTLVTGLHDSTGDSYSETPLNIGDVKGFIYTATPPPVIPATGAHGGTAATMAIAQAGLLAASNFYISISPANKPGGITLSTDELGGRTLAPGIYKSGSSYNISSLDLTLDAQGDANAVWIFQVPSALTVGTTTGARSVQLVNGAQAKNVFWYVGEAAVINYAGGGTMVGTIIANSGVSLSSPGNSTNTTVQTVLNGRAISLVSAVTMVNTVINVPN